MTDTHPVEQPDGSEDFAVPEVTVVIACYNTLETLPLQLEALAHQVDAPRFEIILSDNGSTDGLGSWVQENQHRFPQMRYVDASGTRGAGYARNTGVANARGRKLAFCDADDLVAPWWLASASSALDEVQLVTGSMKWGYDPDFAGELETVWERFFPSEQDTRQNYSNRFRDMELGALSPILAGGCFAITKGLYTAVGGFDTSFTLGAEDNDFAQRAVDLAGPFVLDTHLQLVYRIPLGRAKLAKTFRYGLAAGQFCARHDTWGTSAAFNSNPFLATIKVAVSLPLAKVRGRQLDEELLRLATVSGLAVGLLCFKWLKRGESSSVGAGLGADKE